MYFFSSSKFRAKGGTVTVSWRFRNRCALKNLRQPMNGIHKTNIPFRRMPRRPPGFQVA
ncbi:hypothetical protein HMPREF9371_1668 [Neisseria shayeganii 871]|uniref:Uncharacterized protein n=1 Tax=Neisseria shayeganii 871 TaxID=1032488 RepID=G4CJ79_9NEIS|nr:hypothetical protein HMPREF9371_1668 [Neisseria shayeganii 871]